MEKVLVIKREILNGYDNIFNKELILNKNELYDLVLKNYFFMDRDSAEKDYEHKQIIPYIVIKHSDKVVLLKRTKKQSETRLHDKYSIGIGGHINEVDIDRHDNIIIQGLRRELEEEIFIKEPYSIDFVGLINDDNEDVGRVHLGFLYIIELNDDYFDILEKEKMSGEWIKVSELDGYYSKMETWSQIVFDCFLKK